MFNLAMPNKEGFRSFGLHGTALEAHLKGSQSVKLSSASERLSAIKLLLNTAPLIDKTSRAYRTAEDDILGLGPHGHCE
jgi:hypothetical protein